MARAPIPHAAHGVRQRRSPAERISSRSRALVCVRSVRAPGFLPLAAGQSAGPWRLSRTPPRARWLEELRSARWIEPYLCGRARAGPAPICSAEELLRRARRDHRERAAATAAAATPHRPHHHPPRPPLHILARSRAGHLPSPAASRKSGPPKARRGHRSRHAQQQQQQHPPAPARPPPLRRQQAPTAPGPGRAAPPPAAPRPRSCRSPSALWTSTPSSGRSAGPSRPLDPLQSSPPRSPCNAPERTACKISTAMHNRDHLHLRIASISTSPDLALVRCGGRRAGARADTPLALSLFAGAGPVQRRGAGGSLLGAPRALSLQPHGQEPAGREGAAPGGAAWAGEVGWERKGSRPWWSGKEPGDCAPCEAVGLEGKGAPLVPS